MLTTSTDGCIIIAEVDKDHAKVRGEQWVSEDFLIANKDSFVDMTEELDYGGRIYVMKTDMSPVFKDST
tara:strand:- start:363 stop:569 length:207 start_codon:yes stop_codon:yes gene_type:complete